VGPPKTCLSIIYDGTDPNTSMMKARIEQSLDWSKVVTCKGQTQKTEEYYVPVIMKVIEEMGGQVGSQAGTQQPVDLQDVRWPDGSVVSYECKKVNSGCCFLLNDTSIKPDVYYIFLYARKQKVSIVSGVDLIESLSSQEEASDIKKELNKVAQIVISMIENEVTSEKIKKLFSEVLSFTRCCVLNKIISPYDFGEMFKKTMKIGETKLRPRPNWSIRFPYTPPSPEQVEPHSPVE